MIRQGAFETRDFYLACFLRCAGYELLDLRAEGRRKVFVFHDRPTRRDDVLAYFTHRASNGPTEAINGRLEALRRNALGFRNLINYRIRSMLHCGNLAL